LREWLEDRDVFYVLAIRCRDAMAAPGGPQRADALIAALPARAWRRPSVGAGAHGLREYDRARIPVRTGAWRPGRDRWLLAHRSLKDPYDIACYAWRAWYAHITVSMLALAWLAASRAQAARGEPVPATRA
jgi:hypothetical protein